MTTPTYKVRAGWLSGDWAEIGATYTNAQLADGFRWEELMAGPVPDADVEEIQILRQVSNVANRLTTGQARVQLDNSRGQYTDVGSAQNYVGYSDYSTDAGAFTLSNASVSRSVLPAKDGSIGANALADNSANGVHSLNFPPGFAMNSGQTYCLSGEFYPGTLDRFNFRLRNGAESIVVDANFSIRSMMVDAGPSGAGGATAIGASLQLLSDGWVKCWVAGQLPTTSAAWRIYLINSAGAFPTYVGTSAWIGIRAFQVNDGAYPLDYVTTTNSRSVLPSGAKVEINDIVGVWALSGSSIYGLYSGFTEKWDASPALRDGRKIVVQAADIASRLRPVISTSLLINPTQSAVFQAIMSAANIPTDRYALDTHNELLQFAYLDQITAGDAIAEVQQNGAQFIFVDGRGKLQIKNRNFDVPSLAGFGPYSQAFALAQSLDDTNVINRIQVTTTPREALVNINTVGWISDPVFIPAAGSVDFIVDFIDPTTLERGAPVQNIQSMVAGTDFVFTANIDGGGQILTSNVSLQMTPNATSARIQATNAGSINGYLATCQVKGFAVSRQPDLTQTVKDDVSIGLYQERFQAVTAEMLGTKNRARDLAEFMLVTGSNPKALTTLGLKNEFPDIVQVDLLARVAISNSAMQIGSSFIVQGLDHTITFNAGVEHTTTLDCELAPTKNYFVLDSNVLGHLDLNRLGF